MPQTLETQMWLIHHWEKSQQINCGKFHRVSLTFHNFHLALVLDQVKRKSSPIDCLVTLFPRALSF